LYGATRSKPSRASTTGREYSVAEGLEDLAARQHGDRRPQLLEHLAAEPGEADLQAAQVVE
jgi:hypothetical protein